MKFKPLVEQLCKALLADLQAFEPTATVARCPLCMEPFEMDVASKKRPTAEHIVQSSLGGTREYPLVSCKACNNSATFEKDLKSAMEGLDFMDGDGVIPMTLRNDVGHVAANLIWPRTGPVTIEILGEKASNMKAVQAVPDLIHKNASLGLNLDYGFVAEKYRRAVFRIGYLATFNKFAYSYGFSAAGEIARGAMKAQIPPEGVILEAFPSMEPPVPFFVVESPELSGVLVLFKVRTRMTRWLAVLLPGQTVVPWDSLKDALKNVKQMRATAGFEKFGVSTMISFDRDPVEKLREIRIPAQAV